MNNANQVVLITGASSGMGLATAFYLAKRNYKVYAAVKTEDRKTQLEERSRKNNVSLEILVMDLRSDEAIKNCVKSVVARESKIDVLINNAGYGLTGFFEDCSMEEIKAQFETNFFGALSLTKEVLPVMRQQRSGFIINICSVYDRISFPVTSIYNASKAALAAITEALRIELAPFGIKATAVEPLNIRSGFNKSAILARRSSDPDSPYRPYFDFYLKTTQGADEKKLTDPSMVAKKIYAILNAKNPKPRYLVGKGAKTTVAVKSLMPANLFDSVLRKRFLGI